MRSESPADRDEDAVTPERTVRYQSYSATLLSLFNDAMNGRPTRHDRRWVQKRNAGFEDGFLHEIPLDFLLRAGPLEAYAASWLSMCCCYFAWNHHRVRVRWTFSLITRSRLPACSRSPRITARSLKNYCLITVKSFVIIRACALRVRYMDTCVASACRFDWLNLNKRSS